MEERTKKLLISLNGAIGVLLIAMILIANFKMDIVEYPILFADILILISLALLCTILREQHYLNREEKAVKTLEERNKILEDNFNEIRAFKHDFSNIMQSMGGYIKVGDTEGLKKMYDQVICEMMGINEVERLNKNIIKNPALYNLLNNKFQIAASYGIKCEFNELSNIKNLNIDDCTLCRILGIFIDNAIDETKEIKNKFISIIFKYDSLNNRDLIIVKNTYDENEKGMSISKMYEGGHTTKSYGHGLGLWKVKRIVDSSKNLDIFTSKDKYFTQQLSIYR
jgi:two-component system sensor histidine kinase AgrC